MTPESQPQGTERFRETELLAQGFQKLREGTEKNVFNDLEQSLNEAGFVLGEQHDVMAVMNDNTLVCRSESFSSVLDAVTLGEAITITNRDDANMCIMASGAGFRTAMLEGFSGSDVGNMVKTVIVFKPEHLTSRASIPVSDKLWEGKPDTAQVSLVGGGEVFLEDITMISFRFPIQYYPADFLSEDERDMLEENKIQFIVRHYLSDTRKTMH